MRCSVRAAQVLDELGHLPLGRGREILRDVDRADRLAEGAVHQLHAALPALALRLHARQRLREEVELRLVERLRQVLGVIADEVIGEIRLPRVDRRRREDLAHRDERGVLRHQHGRRRAQPRGLDHEHPVELGRLRLQTIDRLGIVEFGDIAALLRRPLVFGHRGFERDDRVGLGARVTDARECLDALDVRAVRRAIALVFLARKQIVVARHAEPALADDGGVLRRVGQAGDDAEVHGRRIVRRGEQHLERGLVFRCGDPVEIRFERSRAARLDPLHVHPARVEVADLPARGAVLPGVLPHFVEDAANVDLGFVRRRSRPRPPRDGRARSRCARPRPRWHTSRNRRRASRPVSAT